MKTTTAFAVLFLALFCATPAQSTTVTFDWATVGNPGNADELMATVTAAWITPTASARPKSPTPSTPSSSTRSPTPTPTGCTTPQWVNDLGRDHTKRLLRKLHVCGEARLGRQGPGGTDYTYDDKPVVYVSFFDAMRFTNWLENGQPTGAQDASTTEDGVYAISDGAE